MIGLFLSSLTNLCVCLCGVFARSSYEAGQEWALPVQFCQLHSLMLSSVYPEHCAQDGHYVHFLLFVQLHNFPPQQVSTRAHTNSNSLGLVISFCATRYNIYSFVFVCVSLQVRSLAAQFSPALQAHLNLAFQDLQLCCQRGQSRSKDVAESCGGSDQQPELFQVLLQSLEEAEPCRYLLQEALLHRWPTLAVMAACQQVSRRRSCTTGVFSILTYSLSLAWCFIDRGRSLCLASACGC